MSDRLALTEAMEDAGIERAKAARIATVVFDAIHQNVATKADVQTSAATFRADFAAFRGEMRADIARLEGGQGRMLERMNGMESRLLIRIIGPLGSLIIAGLGALFWALQHWPPH